MAKCAICEKGAHFGNNVSHSHRKSPKMWKSNVKSVRVKTENGATKKMYVCTSCLKSGKVERAQDVLKLRFRCVESEFFCATRTIVIEDRTGYNKIYCVLILIDNERSGGFCYERMYEYRFRNYYDRS